MAAMAQLSCPSLAAHYCLIFTSPHTTSISIRLGNNTFPSSQCSKITKPLIFDLQTKLRVPCAGGGGDVGAIGRGAGGGNGGRGEWSGGGGDSDESRSSGDGFGPIGALINGWRSRVVADPQFPFKVLMEEIVGLGSCILGDMVSRPNFGLNELDFVFSTLVVGAILNFVLMYILAPTSSSSIQTLPAIFANSPASHMFEPGPYSLLSRLGTLCIKALYSLLLDLQLD
ncbi:UNVERIFIED_CONTAM: protein RETICULATA-RELATED 3, chloroplastic [Sesamum calycinum]|uniref:Protein RETICULATA-RELATED 3, chloroplastic n=1 Tax=Sesamum calycinum TaxID=2727403 RepID=A0AAW2N0R1_9LAMI